MNRPTITPTMRDVAQRILDGMTADGYAIERLEDDARVLAALIVGAYNATQEG